MFIVSNDDYREIASDCRRKTWVRTLGRKSRVKKNTFLVFCLKAKFGTVSKSDVEPLQMLITWIDTKTDDYREIASDCRRKTWVRTLGRKSRVKKNTFLVFSLKAKFGTVSKSDVEPLQMLITWIDTKTDASNMTIELSNLCVTVATEIYQTRSHSGQPIIKPKITELRSLKQNFKRKKSEKRNAMMIYKTFGNRLVIHR